MSIIRAIKHRLGLSVTPANNFTFDASADNGTMKLTRESGQDIMTVDAAGKVAFPQNTPPVLSMIRCEQQNTHGSTNICIRRFLTNPINTGADITYADSATLGASFTINTPGIYAISYTDNFNAASNMGITLNATLLSSNILSAPIAQLLAMVTTYAASYLGCASWEGYLAAGSVIRAHTSGAGASTSPVVFTITRVV